MSADLQIVIKPAVRGRSLSALSEALSDRAVYSVEDCSIWYENEQTGVFFELRVDPSEERLHALVPVGRASFFFEEASEELERLSREFGLSLWGVDGREELEPGQLRRRWRAACERELRAHDDSRLVAVSRQELHRCWTWNRHREETTRQFEAFDVPRLQFVFREDRPASACIWVDARKALLPMCDVILLERRRLALRGLLGRKEDVVAVPFAEVYGQAKEVSVNDQRAFAVGGSPAAQALFAEAPRAPRRPHWIPEERLIDAEILEGRGEGLDQG